MNRIALTEHLTVGEYLLPVKGGTHQDRVLGVIAWAAACDGDPAISIQRIRELLRTARVARVDKINISDVLARAGHFVTKDDVVGGWRLTASGQRHVSSQLGLSIIGTTSPPISPVRTIAAQISDPVIRGYVQEAILCLEAGALRASVVFLWAGAIRALQEKAMQTGKSAVTIAIQKHDNRAPQMTSINTFAKIKDKDTLLAVRDLGLIDKGEWMALQAGLDLRNQCGHPTKYHPKASKVSAFIEDVVGIVF